MSSAEGEVQEKGYEATFPILLNVGGHPTYFVSLKDQEGLVKQYAFVSLENYSLVGIGDTVSDAQRSYLLRLNENGETQGDSEEIMQEASGALSAIESAVSAFWKWTVRHNRNSMCPGLLTANFIMWPKRKRL